MAYGTVNAWTNQGISSTEICFDRLVLKTPYHGGELTHKDDPTPEYKQEASRPERFAV